MTKDDIRILLGTGRAEWDFGTLAFDECPRCKEIAKAWEGEIGSESDQEPSKIFFASFI